MELRRDGGRLRIIPVDIRCNGLKVCATILDRTCHSCDEILFVARRSARSKAAKAAEAEWLRQITSEWPTIGLLGTAGSCSAPQQVSGFG